MAKAQKSDHRPGHGAFAQSPLAAAHARLLQAEKARRNGELDKALSLCESLLRQHPSYLGALQTLGAVHLVKKNHWEALSCFTKAAMNCPKDWTNFINLAAVYRGLEARELAALTLEQARRLKPDDPEIYVTMGEIHREDREYELAAQAFRQALDLQPDHAGAAFGLGESYGDLGRYAEAAAVLEKVHRQNPESVACLYGLTQLPAAVVNIDVLAALGKLRKLSQQSEEDFQILVGFARASVLHGKGRHKEAWDNLREANKSEFPKHEAEFRKHLDRQEAARQAALEHPVVRSAHGSSTTGDGPRPLFIFGVSRSGKTTLEKLVGALARVKRGYESRLVDRAVRRASQASGLLTIDRLTDLPKSLDGEFSKLYLAELREIAGDSRVFTSTHPGLIPGAGRICTALPQSRFIFVKRDVYDVALRIFAKKYKSGTNHYAYDLKTIFDHISWYDEMVDIWLKKLSTVARVIHYEDMIADPLSILKTVADLCGVPLPEGPLPELGDDRGCAAPYREFMEQALQGRP